MIKANYPWDEMPLNSQRRVSGTDIHGLFWLKDINSRCGFYVNLTCINHHVNKDIINNLKGISITRRCTNEQSELILFLEHPDEYLDVFFTLCKDLIDVVSKESNKNYLIEIIEQRITKWHQFLKLKGRHEFGIEVQMGLFGELQCMLDFVIPQEGIKNAIFSWVGPDFDKQDFLLSKKVLEVKTYKTSKAPIVTISSAYQLYSEEKPLFLIAYGISPSENGKTIVELINDIKQYLKEIDYEIYNLFETKLLEYGYFSSESQELYSFLIDSIHAYDIKSEFPKITPIQLHNDILQVKYKIDLLKCKPFEIKLSSLKD
ncbi:MAG: PD-(D/E)XK motif protein [Sulfurospirillum cavolei]|nr:PD-(D/E)XK motif protein [Sulfurospirillum cavolei]